MGTRLTPQETPAKALLIFIDLVDCSRFSTVLPIHEYVDRLLEFQEVFRDVAHLYFKPINSLKRRACAHRHSDARGDEGIVFVVEPDVPAEAQVLHAIDFVFELKGRMRLVRDAYGGSRRTSNKRKGTAPKEMMEIGAGIHFGDVCAVTRLEKGTSIIDRLEGYAINKAKRIESCSRAGRFSNVFLSQEAAILISGESIVLSGVEVSLKGIEERTEAFEVVSGLFSEIPKDRESRISKLLIERVCKLSLKPAKIQPRWLKPFVLSLLDSQLAKARDADKPSYASLQDEMAWHSPNEADPIALFLRAKRAEEKGESTACLRYARQLAATYPDFIQARKMLVRICSTVAQKQAEPAEKAFGRDVAKEFLDRFSGLLKDSEKKEFKKIVQTCSS